MEKYRKSLAGNKKVALIHVSYDKVDEDALAWAVKENFSWPTITPSKRKESKITKFSRSDYVPEYQLYRADGTPVTEEGEAAVAKALELAKASK